MLQKIHHIDYVVRDLDQAAQQFQKVFGLPPAKEETLESRGIRLRRYRIGETWLILVQPVRSDSPVAAFLEQNGEGFFHIALQVSDIEGTARDMKSRGVRLGSNSPRRGVEGWKLVDIDTSETFGSMMQLVEPA